MWWTVPYEIKGKRRFKRLSRQPGDLQTKFGFKTGSGGAPSSRTMMLLDLTALLAAVPSGAARNDFNRLIVEENCLGKRTSSNRWLTARHLADLYGLDERLVVFRLLRFFWKLDAPAQPMLALLSANARDVHSCGFPPPKCLKSKWVR